MANKVNVGTRGKDKEAEDLAAFEAKQEASGAEIVEEGGAKFAVSKSFGLTIKTRIE